MNRYSLFNDPFFRELERRLPTLTGSSADPTENDTTSNGYCPVNISQDQDHYYIQALVPGVTAEQLELTWQETSLVISGSVAAQPPEGTTVVWNEIRPYRFRRIVQVGDNLDLDRVEARLENGLLTIVAPKAAHARPRTIPVQSMSGSQPTTEKQKQVAGKQ